MQFMLFANIVELCTCSLLWPDGPTVECWFRGGEEGVQRTSEECGVSRIPGWGGHMTCQPCFRTVIPVWMGCVKCGTSDGQVGAKRQTSNQCETWCSLGAIVRMFTFIMETVVDEYLKQGMLPSCCWTVCCDHVEAIQRLRKDSYLHFRLIWESWYHFLTWKTLMKYVPNQMN